MTEPAKVIAVLACFNRKTLTLRCLDSLFAQQGAFTLSAILVDDGGTDGTDQAVRERFPHVRVLRADGQRYWAGAMAQGLKTAMEERADFHLWLNDDVQLYPGALQGLLAAAARVETPSILVGSTREVDRPIRTYCGALRRGRHPLRLDKVIPAPDHGLPCDTFNGNCVLVPFAAFSRLGPADPIFDGCQGASDTDYGLRARQLGIPCLVAPGYVGTCPPNITRPPWTDVRKPLGQRLAQIVGPRGPWHRGQIRFLRRHGGPFWPFLLAVPGLKAIRSALCPPPVPRDPPRVAHLEECVLFPYRHDLLRRLIAHGGEDPVVYHGQPQTGAGADPPATSLPFHRCRNMFWPRSQGRVLWTTGAWSALTGTFDAVVIAEHIFSLHHWLFWIRRRLLGYPKLIVNGHFRFEKNRPGSLAAWALPRLRKALARGADAVLPYTPSGAEACLRIGIAPERIFTTFNTLDTQAVRRIAEAIRPEDRETWRQHLSLEDGPVFLFIGRLYATKRVDLAAQAVLEVRRTGLAATLLVVGTGPDEKKLRRMITTDSSGVAARAIRLLGAEQDEERLAPLFAISTAILIPDALGLAAVHAFAHGIPVLTGPGRHQGVEIEYLAEGANSLTAPQMTAEALAQCMIRLSRDPSLRETLHQGAVRTATELSLDRMVQNMVAATRFAVLGETA